MKKDRLDNKTTASPFISLNEQYIKELHFENTNSLASFSPQKESTKIEFAINVNNCNVGEDIYEVILVVKSKAISQHKNNLNSIDVKLAYAGLVTLKDVIDNEQKEAILNIHIPTLLFPYARHVLSDVTRDGGFQPIMLEPMDFAAIHKQRKQQKADSTSFENTI